MKKSKIRFLIISVVIVCVMLSIYFLSYTIAEYKLGLSDVYIAKVNIRHRKRIEKEHLEKIKVPKAYINENVYTSLDDIIGKYVIADGFIAKGSMFYKDYLEDIDEANDAYFVKLNKNEAAYDLRVRDINVNVATLKEGQYLDLYLTINRKEVVSDLLISSTKLIGIYDNQNKEVINGKDANIATITIALDEKMIPYLNKALALGEIKVTTRASVYDNQKCTINLSEEMLKYLS